MRVGLYCTRLLLQIHRAVKEGHGLAAQAVLARCEGRGRHALRDAGAVSPEDRVAVVSVLFEVGEGIDRLRCRGDGHLSEWLICSLYERQ